MIKSFFFDRKWSLWAWGGFLFIIGSLVAQTWIDVKINGTRVFMIFYKKQQKVTFQNFMMESFSL